MQFTGTTPDQMLEQMKPQALKRIQTRLVLEAITEAEKIEATEEELQKEIEKMAEMYKMEADKLNEALSDYERTSMKKDIAVQKAVDFVAEAAVETAK